MLAAGFRVSEQNPGAIAFGGRKLAAVDSA